MQDDHRFVEAESSSLYVVASFADLLPKNGELRRVIVQNGANRAKD